MDNSLPPTFEDLLIQEEQKAVAQIPDDYIPVTRAGIGVQAVVMFCLPRHSVDSRTSIKDAYLGSLRRELVAVKIPGHLFAPIALSLEVKLLSRITTRKEGHAIIQDRFPTVLDCRNDVDDRLGPVCKLMVMSTSCPSVTFRSFTDCFHPETPIPEFAAHVFLQLGSAIQFLHDEVRIAHRDLHEDNILINLAKRPVSNSMFPDLVLIDFGSAIDLAVDEDPKWSQWEDVYFVCCRVWAVLRGAHGFEIREDRQFHFDMLNLKNWETTELEMWDNFCSTLYKVGTGMLQLKREELWQTFGGFARKVVEEANEECMMRLEEVVEKSKSLANEKVKDEDLRRAIENVATREDAS